MWKTLSKRAFIMGTTMYSMANLATEGVTPEQLFISDLFDRIVDEGITQVIIATSFTMEGDITADYLTNS